MNPPGRDEELRRLLRAGDPLPPGEELCGSASRRMRRAILAETRREPRWIWQTAVAAAALTATIAGAHLWSLVSGSGGGPGPAHPRASRTLPDTRVAVADPVAEPGDRQIQFITRGGTRVIWLLKPKPATQP